MSLIQEINIRPDAVAGKTVVFTYTPDCALTINADGTSALAWDNGKALAATTGGSIGYVPKHLHIHVWGADRKYNFFGDYTAMIDGGVTARCAIILCLMREVMVSIPEYSTYVGETIHSDLATDPVNLGNEIKALLLDGAAYVNDLVQQTFTIMALNGISMVSIGHHYKPDGPMWRAFERATNFGAKVTALGITDDIGLFLHGMAHPTSVEKIAQWVTMENSPYIGKVQGVALTRLGTMPAGTTLVGVGIALVEEVIASVPAVSQLGTGLKKMLEQMHKKIMAKPLEYCTYFQKANTAKHLNAVGQVSDPIVFFYGIHRGANLPQSTVIKSRALVNAAKQNPVPYKLGTHVGDVNKPDEQEAVEMAGRALSGMMAFLDTVGDVLSQMG